jgi:hydrogenase/urease accessory protein HupE
VERRATDEAALGQGVRASKNIRHTVTSGMRLRHLPSLIALVWCAVVRAHDPGLSTTQGFIKNGALELTVGFAPADLNQLLAGGKPPAGRWTEAVFNQSQPQLKELATRLWEVRLADHILSLRDSSVKLESGDSVTCRLVYDGPFTGSLTLRALQLGSLAPGHRQFVSIADERGFILVNKLLRAGDDTLVLPLPAGAALQASSERGSAVSTAPTFWGFLKLGIEHIWTGYDHLLFLFALLVVCRSFRSIVTIITCFTLAHSLTLALATLGILNMPSRLVEPAIAASIVFVGVENLWRRGAEPPRRGILTFAFGLIHGFGFASVLRELGVGQGGQGLAMPLFTFNLGVEIGQVAVASLVLPIVWRLRKNEWFVRRGVPSLSAVVALAGLYWFLERTVLS